MNTSTHARKRRIVIWTAATLLLLILAAATVFWFALKASLPQLDGRLQLPGLNQAVIVERDDLGVPTIRARNRKDAARVTGFLHAQDRFFHMDLSRRMGAGELAELLGPAVLDLDRDFRLHRLRKTAREAVAKLPPAQVELVQAYCEGVNCGLAALGARPPEYLILRSQPEAWRPEDSLLVAYSMFFFLQDSTGRQESRLGVLAEVLPPKAFDFFVPSGTEWDAPIDGTESPIPDLPSPAEFSFKNLADAQPDGQSRLGRPSTVSHGLASLLPGQFSSPADGLILGSNSWAIDGRLSRTGSAMVANDMHLGLRLPNTWYRMRIVCQPDDKATPDLDITGVTLPGVPVIIVGSNRKIAWAFTNSMLDASDLILLEVSPDNPRSYQTPQGPLPFKEESETLRVRGEQDQTLTIETTIWGPVAPGRAGSQKRAICWVAHRPDAVNLNLLELENVSDAETALALAPSCGIPAQNFVVGDRAGWIGWTVMGKLPRRIGFTGMLPVSWADGQAKWDGWVRPEDYPKFVNPPDGRIWTANNRIMGSANYLAAGPWDVDLGARARQIRDGLRQQEQFAHEDMLSIQLDDRALFFQRWRDLLLATLALPETSRVKEANEARTLVENWGARAAVDSQGYRLTRGFRIACLELALAPLTNQCRKIDPDFEHPTRQVEHSVWVMLNERPAHLLNPEFETYDELLISALEKTLANLREQGLDSSEATWGRKNTVSIEHPLSAGIPFLGKWLNIKPQPLPGDSHMPRVQSPTAGASERLVVSPGHEEQGLFHMPGGQSGHFLSEYYRKGHDAWAEGKATPFLPGPTRHTLTLSP
ncbi:MAG TPA: penicillin acylase family protein [Acidobacteriota bacterium]|nr:penicillin acylase family protein [Acidobacteriota bacterium]